MISPVRLAFYVLCQLREQERGRGSEREREIYKAFIITLSFAKSLVDPVAMHIAVWMTGLVSGDFRTQNVSSPVILE